MPAAVAIPLITTAVGTGVSLFQQKKQNDAAKQQATQQNAQIAADNASGGGGGSSSSGGSHSESHGGTVVDSAVRNAAFGANQSFLENGGLTNENLANLRARALSPVRAAYSNARREVDRGTALQGGYSPNRNASLARMAREQGQSVADAATNAEGQVVGMQQQGRMAGLQGMNSMYANMPNWTDSVSDSWNSGSSSGGGGGSQLPVQVPKGGIGIGDVLSTAANVGLPIALNQFGKKSPAPINTTPIPRIPAPIPGAGPIVPSAGGGNFFGNPKVQF